VGRETRRWGENASGSFSLSLRMNVEPSRMLEDVDIQDREISLNDFFSGFVEWGKGRNGSCLEMNVHHRDAESLDDILD